jgi:uncharacterized membrane protein YgaE (UPF0421/DUF939 family)
MEDKALELILNQINNNISDLKKEILDIRQTSAKDDEKIQNSIQSLNNKLDNVISEYNKKFDEFVKKTDCEKTVQNSKESASNLTTKNLMLINSGILGSLEIIKYIVTTLVAK